MYVQTTKMIFLIFLAALICSSACQRDCTTPNGERGSCKLFPQCSHLMEQWNSAPKSPVSAVTKLLRDLNCGFEGLTPKVCCAIRSESVDEDEDDDPPIVQYRGLPPTCGDFEGVRITNGNKTGIYEFPWMVLLAESGKDNEFLCGGSIINEWYILTAAHCFKFGGISNVRIGEHNIKTPIDCEISDDEEICAPKFQDIKVDQIVIHPMYNKPARKQNDIALIRLKTPIDFNTYNTRPICLPMSDKLRNLNVTGRKMLVAGWGATENSTRSDELLKANILVVDNSRCSRRIISEGQLCAGGDTDSDSCAGDSGGPLMIVEYINGVLSMVQHGIVSYGPSTCGIVGMPGVYTRVSPYVDWILGEINKPRNSM
ncbi:CLIP domain-containing serine protease B4-like [Arctopsyche grandis]|uniref:CLIP domain-containing serine protease B4-like n=1 Tax=Arctopsyche grandis TaxID=121162 RepID=UPI00406D8C7E